MKKGVLFFALLFSLYSCVASEALLDRYGKELTADKAIDVFKDAHNFDPEKLDPVYDEEEDREGKWSKEKFDKYSSSDRVNAWGMSVELPEEFTHDFPKDIDEYRDVEGAQDFFLHPTSHPYGILDDYRSKGKAEDGVATHIKKYNAFTDDNAFHDEWQRLHNDIYANELAMRDLDKSKAETYFLRMMIRAYILQELAESRGIELKDEVKTTYSKKVIPPDNITECKKRIEDYFKESRYDYALNDARRILPELYQRHQTEERKGNTMSLIENLSEDLVAVQEVLSRPAPKKGFLELPKSFKRRLEAYNHERASWKEKEKKLMNEMRTLSRSLEGADLALTKELLDQFNQQRISSQAGPVQEPEEQEE